MEISERIFVLIKDRKMTQKEFAETTGIPIPTINDWKRKGTNPSSGKILTICECLQVSPQYLLSGDEEKTAYLVADSNEERFLLESYRKLNVPYRNRLMGYLQALIDLKK